MLSGAAALVPTLPTTSRRAVRFPPASARPFLAVPPGGARSALTRRGFQARTELNMVFGKTRASQKSYVPAVDQSSLQPGKSKPRPRSPPAPCRRRSPPAVRS